MRPEIRFWFRLIRPLLKKSGSGSAKYHPVISLIVANKILTPGKCSSLYGVPVAKIAFQKTAFAEIATIASMVPDADFKLDACQKRRK